MDKLIQSEVSEEIHMQIIAELPWYVNGTLTDMEYHRIKMHLTQCTTCKKEVEVLQKLKTAIQQQESKTNWQPEPAHLQSIFNKIDHIAPTTHPVNDGSISVWQKICDNFNSLFETPSAMRWVITAQSTLVIVLSIIIAILIPNSTSQTYWETYATEKPSALVHYPQVRIVLSESMPLKELTLLLSKFSATIIDGPSLRGIVTIQLNSNNIDLNTILNALRQNKYVEFAEIVD